MGVSDNNVARDKSIKHFSVTGLNMILNISHYRWYFHNNFQNNFKIGQSRKRLWFILWFA